MTIETIHNAPCFTHAIVCTDANGREKWREQVSNLVTTGGKTDMITQYFKGSAYTAAWYLGLKASGAASVNDTLASHAGWNEIAPYAGSRSAITFGTSSGGSNTASPVAVAINASAIIYGAFVTSAASGSSGALYSISDFSVARSVNSGDTLRITPTVSVS